MSTRGRKSDPDWQMYSVGDELEVVEDYSSHGFPIGSMATIVRVDSDNGWFYYRAEGVGPPPRNAPAERWITHGDLADPVSDQDVEAAIASIKRVQQ